MFELFKNLTQLYVFVFVASLILSLVLVRASIYLLNKLNIMDKPDHVRKIHTKPIPRMGGIAIYVAFVIPMIAVMYFDNTQKGIILGSGLALIIGAADDIWGVPAVIKLITLFALTLLIRHYGVITSLPFHIFGLSDKIFNIILTMLWLTGITSALNALDHMDGLAGGFSFVATAAYLAVSIQTGQFFWGLMSVSLMGSLLGYLFFNWHPAKIFMGDSGSFFLGFSLASIGIMGGWSKNPIKAAIIPLAILSLPIFDLIFVVIYRRIKGITHSIKESITYCGKDHIGHRLVQMGFSQVNAVRIVYLISTTVAISALIIRFTSYWESALLLLQIILIYIILIIIMTPLMNNFNKEKTIN